MTIEISSETEQLLLERMQTGSFATVDEAIYQALDLSPPDRRERELIKILRDDWTPEEEALMEEHLTSDDLWPSGSSSATESQTASATPAAPSPIRTMAEVFRVARGLGGDGLEFPRDKSLSREIDLS